ncbi:MAG: hypothetical protein WAW92_04210 [Minisyncoccia bacterium]
MNPDKNSMENSRIEKLKKALYSRNVDILPKEERSTFESRETNAPAGWGAPKSFEYTVDPMTTKRNNSFFNKFLLVSSIIFFISLGTALFIFYGGLNMISSNNLDVRIVAPSSVSSGEELPIGLTIINGNRTDLEDVYLIVDYPEGAQSITSGKPLIYDRISLGTIAKGDSTEYSLRSVLFGEKDIIKDFSFKIEYKVKGSNATFTKEKLYSLSIGSSPILVSINYPKETNSGQEIKFVINMTSNSAVSLKNTLVRIDYPYGFTYKSSNIKPFRDNSVWNIGDLKDGEKKILEISGVLLGQNEEDKTFKITAGTQSQDSSKEFEAELVNQDVTIGIRKSFFDLAMDVDNRNSIKIGDSATVLVRWRNTLPDKILNARIEASISGNILDRNKVNIGGGGYYQSVDNLLVWNKNNNEDLIQILPAEGNQVSFSITSLTDPQTVIQTKNPHLDVHVKISGDRSGTDTSVVTSEGDIIIKILSTLSITAKSFRNVGPFTNIGPVPPRADKETTYTVTWTVSNTTNDLSNVTAEATLKEGVIWKGDVSPLSEKVKYDPDSRIITWNVGSVSPGVGYYTSPRTVSFRVGIVPSINQIGSTPELLSLTKITATDTYVGAPVSDTYKAVTTQFSDATYRSTDSVVGQ